MKPSFTSSSVCNKHHGIGPTRELMSRAVTDFPQHIKALLVYHYHVNKKPRDILHGQDIPETKVDCNESHRLNLAADKKQQTTAVRKQMLSMFFFR